LFIVNKADRDGADRTATQVESALQLSMTTGWNPPVLKVSAELNTGIDSVVDTIERHHTHLVASGKLDALKMRMAKLDVLENLKARLADTMKHQLDHPSVQAELEKVASKQSDPYSLADIIVEQSWRDA
ncbi:MAG: hypothetical protein NT102_02415, partial [Caldiserica bacterium]|nr:hypothetical protein [Caldisericota bacterium]